MPKIKLFDAPPSQYLVIGAVSEMGRSRLLVRCTECEADRWIHKWSWAGYGLAWCGSRQHALSWRNVGHALTK